MPDMDSTYCGLQRSIFPMCEPQLSAEERPNVRRQPTAVRLKSNININMLFGNVLAANTRCSCAFVCVYKLKTEWKEEEEERETEKEEEKKENRTTAAASIKRKEKFSSLVVSMHRKVLFIFYVSVAGSSVLWHSFFIRSVGIFVLSFPPHNQWRPIDFSDVFSSVLFTLLWLDAQIEQATEMATKQQHHRSEFIRIC